MLVKSIRFSSPLPTGEDIYDDNIDVFVTLEDGFSYSVVVETHKNILSLMEKEQKNFLPPGCPSIIVKELTMEVIREAIEAYAEGDAYWLKFHSFAPSIDRDTFDKIQKADMEYDIEDDE